MTNTFSPHYRMELEDDAVTEAVEEGDPVKPGDTLVVSEPFVYAVQPQFRSKVCDFCLK